MWTLKFILNLKSLFAIFNMFITIGDQFNKLMSLFPPDKKYMSYLKGLVYMFSKLWTSFFIFVLNCLCHPIEQFFHLECVQSRLVNMFEKPFSTLILSWILIFTFMGFQSRLCWKITTITCTCHFIDSIVVFLASWEYSSISSALVYYASMWSKFLKQCKFPCAISFLQEKFGIVKNSLQ